MTKKAKKTKTSKKDNSRAAVEAATVPEASPVPVSAAAAAAAAAPTAPAPEDDGWEVQPIKSKKKAKKPVAKVPYCSLVFIECVQK